MAASSKRVDAASRERSEAPPKPESRRARVRDGDLGAVGEARGERDARTEDAARPRGDDREEERTESTAAPVSLAVLHELVGEVAIRPEGAA